MSLVEKSVEAVEFFFALVHIGCNWKAGNKLKWSFDNLSTNLEFLELFQFFDTLGPGKVQSTIGSFEIINVIDESVHVLLTTDRRAYDLAMYCHQSLLCTATNFCFGGKYDLIQLHRQIIHQNDGKSMRNSWKPSSPAFSI